MPYEEALKDGAILCKYINFYFLFFPVVLIEFHYISKSNRLMNKLQPNAIPKYSTSGGSFQFRENIALFRK